MILATQAGGGPTSADQRDAAGCTAHAKKEFGGYFLITEFSTNYDSVE
jgi:hypothetical protein